MLHPSWNASPKFCHVDDHNSWLRQFSALSSERLCDNASGPCNVRPPYVSRTPLPSFKWFLNLRKNPRTFSGHCPGTSVQFEGHLNTEAEAYSLHKPHFCRTWGAQFHLASTLRLSTDTFLQQSLFSTFAAEFANVHSTCISVSENWCCKWKRGSSKWMLQLPRSMRVNLPPFADAFLSTTTGCLLALNKYRELS